MRRRPWIGGALYAEGASDYRFLLELLPRVVRDAAHRLFGPDFEESDGMRALDAPEGQRPRRRSERILAAVEAAETECNLLFIHADGNGDPERARAERVQPAAEHVTAQLAVVPCVPVRETEAWLLVDAPAFSRAVGSKVPPDLPERPEALTDPKATLQRVLTTVGVPAIFASDLYPAFGREVPLDALRRLAAFRRMEDDLETALRRLAERA